MASYTPRSWSARLLDVGDGQLEEHVSGVLARRRGGRDRLVVVVGVGDRLLEDGRVRGDPHHPVVHPLAERARAEPAPADVVEPRAGARGRKLMQPGHCVMPPSRIRESTRAASSATCRGVKPRWSSTVWPGAEAPKRSIAMIAPRGPANRSQPRRRSGLDADAGLDGGRQHLVAIGLRLLVEQLPRRQRHHPAGDTLARPAARAPPGRCAPRSRSRSGSRPGRRRPPARSRRGPRRTPAAPTASSTGSACLVRHRAVGLRRSIATRHPTVVSFASAGRKTVMLGVARRVASCSTGWWVGPSSPRPTESWV